MATDSKGKPVQFGDYLIVEAQPMDDAGIVTFSGVVRVIKLSETTRGTSAVGGFVDLIGHGRIGKVKIDVTKATLVARANGEVV